MLTELGLSHAGAVARPLAGGEINETFRVTCGTADLVVRRAPEPVADWHATVEGQRAAMALARRAGVPVPDVRYASGRILVYDYVTGRPLAESQCAAFAAGAGRLHGLLHTVDGDGTGPVQADGSSARWTEDVFFAGVDTWVAKLTGMPASPVGRADVEAARSLLEHYKPEHRRRLVHGDASPFNLLAKDGALVAMIDFDDAWFTDPASDLAWWWWYSPETAPDFERGAASVSEPTPALDTWMYRLRHLLGLADHFVDKDAHRMSRIAWMLPVAVDETRRLLGRG